MSLPAGYTCVGAEQKYILLMGFHPKRHVLGRSSEGGLLLLFGGASGVQWVAGVGCCWSKQQARGGPAAVSHLAAVQDP